MGNLILKLVCFLQLFDLSTPLGIIKHFYFFAHVAVKRPQNVYKNAIFQNRLKTHPKVLNA